MPLKESIKIPVEDLDAIEEGLPAKKIKKETAAKKPVTLEKKSRSEKKTTIKTAKKQIVSDKSEVVVFKTVKKFSMAASPEPKKEPEPAQKPESQAVSADKVKKTKNDFDIDKIFSEKSNLVKDVIMEEEKKNADVEADKNDSQESLTPEVIPNVRVYKKIAYFFIFFTVILVLGVVYFSVAKVKITLIPNQERISNNMIFDVVDKDNSAYNGTNSIKGIVKNINITKEKEYDATGEDVIGEEAVGTVEIINNYSKNQPLVATTRMISADGKLFRLKNTVNIPAGGTVNAEIYADIPSAEMAIGPTKFTIPGLWAGLQDKIFAESKAAIVYQKKVKKHVVDSDIENAVRDLKEQMLTEAKIKVNEEYRDYGQILYKIDENSISSVVNAKAGDVLDKFSASMDAEIVVVAFNNEQAGSLAQDKFVSSLAESKEMISFDKENIIYALNSYNENEGSAVISATFEGKASLKQNYDIIQLDKIIGLNERQLDTYLSGIPEIAGFEVSFFPSFIKRVPKLNDRIEIEIKK
jgi:hypothetical protein